MREDPLHPVPDEPTLPRVLLLGDSISIGYHLNVRARLEGVANVHRPDTNCGHTGKGVAMLRDWLAAHGDRQWDVIHFNWVRAFWAAPQRRLWLPADP
jgi:hypothetical protein|eukprot:COSAG01_NODE_12021_length_1814_cov_3.865306_3_plen_98_part_00